MKNYLILTVCFVSLVSWLGCGKEDLQNKQQALENKVSFLESRVASLEKLLKKPADQNIAQIEVKKQEVEKTQEKTEEKKAEQNPENNKNKPNYFNFPEFKIEIKNFKVRMGIGGIAEFYGDIVNHNKKNINYLSLATEFYDEYGNLIGGHSFPLKLVFANKERRFFNSDSVQGTFKNVARYDIKIKYVGFEGYQIEEEEKTKD